eukprot:jgi/Orpsp1_1/1184695/evm.model.c7180000090614.1
MLKAIASIFLSLSLVQAKPISVSSDCDIIKQFLKLDFSCQTDSDGKLSEFTINSSDFNGKHIGDILSFDSIKNIKLVSEYFSIISDLRALKCDIDRESLHCFKNQVDSDADADAEKEKYTKEILEPDNDSDSDSEEEEKEKKADSAPKKEKIHPEPPKAPKKEKVHPEPPKAPKKEKEVPEPPKAPKKDKEVQEPPKAPKKDKEVPEQPKALKKEKVDPEPPKAPKVPKEDNDSEGEAASTPKKEEVVPEPPKEDSDSEAEVVSVPKKEEEVTSDDEIETLYEEEIATETETLYEEETETVTVPSEEDTEVDRKLPDHDIIIVYTNDVHCGVDENIGYAGLSYYRKEVEKLSPYVSLVDAGDSVQGATIGSISNGTFIIEIMNALQYDVATIGNHEFDYGMEQFNVLSKNLSCSYVSCNFRNTVTNELVFDPYRMMSYGDVKVAYVGITTPDTLKKSNPSSFMDDKGNFIYDFDDDYLYSSVQKAVDDAKKEGADYVVALGHLGELIDVTEEWSAFSVVQHTRGIDVFIDGHSHEVTPSLLHKNIDGKEILITQAGTKLAYVGQVVIHTDGSITTGLVSPESITGKDESITKVIEDIKEKYNEIITKYITYTNFDLVAFDENRDKLAQKGETNLANLITDAILIGSRNFGEADIALFNSGAIRDNIKAGNVTINDSLSVLPFSNMVSIIEIPGQTILDVLEMGARKYPEPNGGLLQVSGMSYAIDPEIESTVEVDENNIFVRIAGNRRVHSVMINGEPIDPSRAYKVAVTSFIAHNKGDGFVFENIIKDDNSEFASPSDLLTKYMEGVDSIPEEYKSPQGRLTFAKSP